LDVQEKKTRPKKLNTKERFVKIPARALSRKGVDDLDGPVAQPGGELSLEKLPRETPGQIEHRPFNSNLSLNLVD